MIDWMILLLTQSIANYYAKWYRILSASFFGSLVVPLAILFPAFDHQSWLLKVCHSFVIVFIAFGFQNLATYLKLLSTFYFMTFAIGGGLLATHFLYATESISNLNHVLNANEVHVLFVVIGFPIVLAFTKYRMDKHKFYQFKGDFLYRVSIHWQEKSCDSMGYLDSGNQLVDPITQVPVIIADEYVLTSWFTDEELMKLKKNHQQMLEGSSHQLPSSSFRLVPFQGVKGETELLLVFKPDFVKIQLEPNPLKVERVLIGIQFGNLASDKSYHCLLHPKLFQKAG